MGSKGSRSVFDLLPEFTVEGSLWAGALATLTAFLGKYFGSFRERSSHEIKKDENERAHYEAIYKEQDKLIARIKADLDEAADKRRQAEDSLSEVSRRLFELTQSNLALLEANASLQSHVDRLEEKIDQLSKDLSSYKQRISALEQENEQLLRRISENET